MARGGGCTRSRLCSRNSASTLALGLGFVAMGTSRILLLKFSANAENEYDYLPVSVNLFAEALKLVFCLVMSVKVLIQEDRSFRDWGCHSWADFLGYMKWSVPAFLYFLDNLIIFYVLSYLQPAMAVLFSNFGILTTALLFRLVLKRRLSWVQWASLLILFFSIVSLTTGAGGSDRVSAAIPGLRDDGLHRPSNSCLEEEEEKEEDEERRNASDRAPPWSRVPLRALSGLGVGLGHAFLLLQCFISSAANVYNEKILKDRAGESIFTQNAKLYAFGLAFNGLALGADPASRALIGRRGLLHGHTPLSAALVVVTAALGLSVSLILKFRDNMFHVLTSQLTAVLVSALSLALFRFRPAPGFFLSAPVVLLAIFVYNAGGEEGGQEGAPQRGERPAVGHHDWGKAKRSRGDGEELVRLTKPDSDSEEEEEEESV